MADPKAWNTPDNEEKAITFLSDALEELRKSTGHDEMWGVTLKDESHVPTAIVLQKFLRANNNDAYAAKTQLEAALKLRKEMQPNILVDSTAYNETKFGELGYVTCHKGEDGKEVVITWNIYGVVKNNKATFGDVDE
jgi:phosphatidylinositol transfer protein SFH5